MIAPLEVLDPYAFIDGPVAVTWPDSWLTPTELKGA